MKTYDCFLFFDELDLLEIRLNYLDKYIDHFVLVESKRTFSGQTKSLIFEENKGLFDRFLNRITHVVIDSNYDNPWRNERFQRDNVIQGLSECEPDDLIIVSDCDEIPRREKIYECDLSKPLIGFNQTMYYYHFNGRINLPWCGSKAFLRKNCPEKISSIRDVKLSPENLLFDGGWHFSFLGQPERIAKKIRAFSHQELNRPEYTNSDKISDRISQERDPFDRDDIQISYVPIDSTFPDYIVQNQERFKHLIKS